MDQIKIGKFISELRKEKGMTQEQLAEKLGVTQRSVSRWETGKNMPDISLLQLLSSELNISVSELLDGEKSKVEKKSTDEAINQVIDYSIQSKRSWIFRQKDVNFITGVIAVLIILLAIIGSVIQAQTIPTIILGLAGIAVVFRLHFGRCSGCGELLPFSLKSIKSCPFCGIKF